MHFKDIPQLTAIGSYQINVPFDNIERTLTRFDEAYGLELCPDFQRGHVWTGTQQSAYVEFLLRGGTSAKVIYFNCPTFGGHRKGDGVPMVLVDGLQRLTAVRRFLRNEIRAFGHLADSIEGLDRRCVFTLDLLFNVNNLSTRAEVLKWYLEYNSGGTPHSKEELERVASLLQQESKHD